MKIRLISLLTVLVALAVGCGRVSTSPLALIPQPQMYKVHSGMYTFSFGEQFTTNLKGTERSDLATVLGASPFGLQMSEDEQAPFCFELTDSIPGIASAEGYTLAVGRDGVHVEAVTATGLFYAFQSLLQLAEEGPEEGSWSLPYVDISDYPRFDYRGLHLDVSRHCDTRRLYLIGFDPAGLGRDQTVFAVSNLVAAKRLTGHSAAVLLSSFNSFRHQHISLYLLSL